MTQKAAVRFLREHAKEYGIDPAKIGVLGDSAGGYLAQMSGATNGEKQFDKGDFLNQSSDVQAVVSLYGLSDLRNIGEGFPEEIRVVHDSPAVTEALLVNGPAFNTFPAKALRKIRRKCLMPALSDTSAVMNLLSFFCTEALIHWSVLNKAPACTKL